MEAVFDSNIVPQEGKGDLRDFFERLRTEINIHEVMLETDIATQQLKNFYNAIVNMDVLKLAKQNSETFTPLLIQKATVIFFENLLKHPFDGTIALSSSNDGLLIWAEVNEYEDASHYILIAATSITNVAIYDTGFSVKLSVVEKSDGFKIPSQYIAF